MPRTPHARFDKAPGCHVEATLSLIGGKWKGVLLYHLFEKETMRFNELRRSLPTITQRMLTNQLRELERDGIVIRQVFAEVPPKVEYSLSDLGKTLKPIMDALNNWGKLHFISAKNNQIMHNYSNSAQNPNTRDVETTIALPLENGGSQKAAA